MKAIGWALWISWQLLSLSLAVFGWFLLLPLAYFGAWHLRPGRSAHYPNRIIAAWAPEYIVPLTLLIAIPAGAALGWPFGVPAMTIVLGAALLGAWDNEEDGVTGAEWYRKAHADSPAWWLCYRWAALRNSTNNLRFLPGIFLVLDRKLITVTNRPSVTVVSHGWRQCVILHPRWLPKALRFGWRILPDAATGDYAWPVLEAD